MSLLTANFKNVLGLEADTVKGIVISAAVAAAVWTLVSIGRALATPSKSKVVDETIDKLKHQRSA